MLVKDRMTFDPTTVRPDSDPMAAQTLLRYARFGRLPVVDRDEQLVGIVTAGDLELFFSTAPSPGVVKRQFRVDQVMTAPAITVSPDYPLEEAAKLMIEHNISGLPVVEAEQLVGIITKRDIFDQLVEALGGDTPSLRLTIQVPDRPGQLARVANQIAALNCNICSLLTARARDCAYLTMRLQGAERTAIVKAIQELEGIEVVHVWESSESDPASK